MTCLRDTIGEALTAERERDEPDEVRLATLRLIKCAIKQRDIDAHARDEATGCQEGEVKAILSTMLAQREESVRTYEEAGRPDLAERERDEMDVIREFLPKALPAKAVETAAKDVIDEVGATGLKDLGRCMGTLKERYDGRMDFAKASAVVKQLLQ